MLEITTTDQFHLAISPSPHLPISPHLLHFPDFPHSPLSFPIPCSLFPNIPRRST
ncbi:MAG: hypothetical protein F6J94_09735 [Moorea sp. SIO1F2]|uniref:hypothetical protein n=1 Tax=unclassified Moorena TaxID=2683338 RepID=UPI0013B79521|nr:MULTISPECIES: hypothetical protein [unclassified Moorena]NEN98697.1 hypothetical protein [Moorena sp. SIO3I7]NEO21390.1 hypothetical protein [Moorena sp. SIO4A5]NEO67932.1 hypothetical protein [Moorena sp. SIO4G2]NEQ60392.1 hypothetical protein [Moorena sp. SIO4A1]NEP24658.1 hypothetical protein [Moorena sp. SIO3I6]